MIDPSSSVVSNVFTILLCHHLSRSHTRMQGQEDYDNLRPLSYPETDVFLIVFDISNPTSLENVSHKWVPEVRSYCQKTPIILVGNKADLRNDPRFQSMSGSVVTQEQAISAAKQLGCVEYCECSAKSQLGLKQTFDRAMQAVLAPKLVKPSPERKKCSIL